MSEEIDGDHDLPPQSTATNHEFVEMIVTVTVNVIATVIVTTAAVVGNRPLQISTDTSLAMTMVLLRLPLIL